MNLKTHIPFSYYTRKQACILSCSKLIQRIEGSLRFLTAFSEAPIYLFRSSGPLMEINLKEHAAAAAPTMCVFPHPGGPYKSKLDLNLKGALAKMSGNFEGNSTICKCKCKNRILAFKV